MGKIGRNISDILYIILFFLTLTFHWARAVICSPPPLSFKPQTPLVLQLQGKKTGWKKPSVSRPSELYMHLPQLHRVQWLNRKPT